MEIILQLHFLIIKRSSVLITFASGNRESYVKKRNERKRKCFLLLLMKFQSHISDICSSNSPRHKSIASNSALNFENSSKMGKNRNRGESFFSSFVYFRCYFFTVTTTIILWIFHFSYSVAIAMFM